MFEWEKNLVGKHGSSSGKESLKPPRGQLQISEVYLGVQSKSTEHSFTPPTGSGMEKLLPAMDSPITQFQETAPPVDFLALVDLRL